MESLLKPFGLQKRLARQFTEGFFRNHLEIGKENRVTGQGLRDSVITKTKKKTYQASKF